MPVSNEHTFDHEKPIPPFFSRYPKRSPEELQHLMRNSRQAARASTTLLREAANLAKYVKDDEHWIAKYSEKKVLTASKRTAAIAAAEAIANVSQDATMCPVSDTTGGHSNTNHAVPWIYTNDFYQTPDVESNRIRELMRNRLDRIRLEQPESRTEERWDKPRAPGERRRRIVRDKDAPEAPAEPRPSGYTLFVFLMTTKLRHDRGPDVEHSQAEILQQISHHWRVVLKEKEQEHYNRMVQEIRQEYQEQMLEFRATDAFRPSERFIKLGDGQGPWVHKNPEERNELEAEVASYETVGKLHQSTLYRNPILHVHLTFVFFWHCNISLSSSSQISRPGLP